MESPQTLTSHEPRAHTRRVMNETDKDEMIEKLRGKLTDAHGKMADQAGEIMRLRKEIREMKDGKVIHLKQLLPNLVL